MPNEVIDMKPMQFPNYRVFELDLAGRPLKVETGKMAGLANRHHVRQAAGRDRLFPAFRGL